MKLFVWDTKLFVRDTNFSLLSSLGIPALECVLVANKAAHL